MAARESSPHVRPFCYTSLPEPPTALKFISLLLVPLLPVAGRHERSGVKLWILGETLQARPRYLATFGVPLNIWKQGKIALVAFAQKLRWNMEFRFPIPSPLIAGRAAAVRNWPAEP